jgi:hypothetical protein
MPRALVTGAAGFLASNLAVHDDPPIHRQPETYSEIFHGTGTLTRSRCYADDLISADRP